MRYFWVLFAIAFVGCRPTIQHAEMAPDVLDFGIIDIDDEKSLPVTFTNLEAEDVYLYVLAPSTFEADMVPAGDDQGTPFDLEDEILLPGSVDLTLDIVYGCWAQDRGFFRWELTILSALEAEGYWEATREVGELTLKGSCGSDDQ